MNEVWLFGNIDLPQDSLPLRLRERLAREFPRIKFIVQDPLDEWILPKELYIIDTVQDLKVVTVFHSLDEFSQERRVTMHDFDLGMQLRMLEKVGQLPPLTILGVPAHLDAETAFHQLAGPLIQLFGRPAS